MTPAELRKILEAMTPGPWTWEPSRTAAGTPYQHVRARHVGVCDTYLDDPICFIGGSPFATPESLDADGDEWVSARHGNAHDATGIAALRNAAEALVELWEAAEAYETDTALLDRDVDMVHVAISRGTERRLHAALVRLKEVKP